MTMIQRRQLSECHTADSASIMTAHCNIGKLQSSDGKSWSWS